MTVCLDWTGLLLALAPILVCKCDEKGCHRCEAKRIVRAAEVKG